MKASAKAKALKTEKKAFAKSANATYIEKLELSTRKLELEGKRLELAGRKL